MPTASKTREIDVRVFPSFRSNVKAAWVRAVARAALAAGDPDGTGHASVVIADDETLHELNLRYRGFDEVTDVLSFGDDSADDADLPDLSVAFPADPDTRPSLGEVILSYPLAVRQADEHNVTLEWEVALLIVHGVLHLLGHDHTEPGDEAAMQSLEQLALAQVFQTGESR